MGAPTSQKIGQIYDKLIEFVQSKLPDHKELRDNVVIENNSDKDLALGFAVSFGASNQANINLDCPLYCTQEVVVAITQANDGSDEDRNIRKRSEKKILGHRDDVIKLTYTDNDLDGLCTKFDFTGADSIQDVIKDQDGHRFLLIEMRFTITYKDSL